MLAAVEHPAIAARLGARLDRLRVRTRRRFGERECRVQRARAQPGQVALLLGRAAEAGDRDGVQAAGGVQDQREDAVRAAEFFQHQAIGGQVEVAAAELRGQAHAKIAVLAQLRHGTFGQVAGVVDFLGDGLELLLREAADGRAHFGEVWADFQLQVRSPGNVVMARVGRQAWRLAPPWPDAGAGRD